MDTIIENINLEAVRERRALAEYPTSNIKPVVGTSQKVC